MGKKVRETDQYTICLADNSEHEPLLLGEHTRTTELGKQRFSNAYTSPKHFAEDSMALIRDGYIEHEMYDKGNIKSLHITIIVEYEENDKAD